MSYVHTHLLLYGRDVYGFMMSMFWITYFQFQGDIPGNVQ
nr:MAG TPA: hypothetical protein [Caudoviricetes sp.]